MCFVKVLPRAASARLVAEAEGLAALAPAVRVPQIRAQGETEAQAWLALEWLELRRPGLKSAEALGRAIAAAHGVSAEEFGWHADNWIGAARQRNAWMPDWTRFFAERRMAPQLAVASRLGANTLVRLGERLLAVLPELLGGHRPPPALVHGDLWGGNWAALPDGTPVVFDPAVHYADRECDLAMSELFGGFPASFYAAYRDAWPLDSGYDSRRSLYQLYHLLNHFNLFGGHYGRQAEVVMARLLTEAR